MKFFLPRIQHNYASFDALARLHAQTKEYLFRNVEIDMNETHRFDADMCAAFGAILYGLGSNLNTVNLVNLRYPVEQILSKNGFLSHYGRVEIPDRWGTTISYRQFDDIISYQRFDDKDDHYFIRYIENEFIHRPEIPKMSWGLLKKFRESIFEIFSNAVLHSRTQLGIFSCGQFFPSQNRLNFTVADRGVGIRQNIRDYEGLNLSPERAIVWATEGNTTTKRDNVPGGLGLKLLGEFIDLNKGCIEIVSDAGYWQRRNGKIVTKLLNYPFPGTIVSVEINTADTHSYILTSEMDAKDIF